MFTYSVSSSIPFTDKIIKQCTRISTKTLSYLESAMTLQITTECRLLCSQRLLVAVVIETRQHTTATLDFVSAAPQCSTTRPRAQQAGQAHTGGIGECLLQLMSTYIIHQSDTLLQRLAGSRYRHQIPTSPPAAAAA